MKSANRAGEFVNLLREPHNQYDSNAIRVDNMISIQVAFFIPMCLCRLAVLVSSFWCQFMLINIYYGESFRPWLVSAWNKRIICLFDES